MTTESTENNNIKIGLIERILRFVGYYAFYIFCLFVVTYLRLILIGNNNNGEDCDYESWHYGDIYQYNSGGICAFSVKYIISMYILLVPLYLLFDVIRRFIIGYNPDIKSRLSEIGVWFVLYFLILMFILVGQPDWVMFYTGFIGVSLYFSPMIILAIVTKYLSKRQEILIFFTIPFIYIILIFILHFFFT